MTDAGILAPRPLPDGPLIAFYGDDFTGSSAVMEVTAFAGLPTVLFLKPPSPARLAAFRHYRVIGVAGTARSQSPAWMEAHLPAVFDALAELGTPIVHYKVCSTFDSSPEIGSIGRAADIAARRFPGWTPLIVADPGMQRFQAFGHLFARLGAEVHRLDRHPTMSLHPVTPMDEADLGRHLARQTGRRIGLVDLAAMKRGAAEARLAQELAAGAAIVSLDVIDRETLVAAGRLVWEQGARPAFALGSQGFEAALVAWWREAGLLPAEPPRRRFGAVDRLACVSGSVCPVTADQIAHAQAHGFAAIRLDAARLVDAAALASEIERVAAAMLHHLGEGRDAIAFSAAGADDPAVAALRTAAATAGVSIETVNERIGTALGRILERTVLTARLSRAVVSGGDTSGRAVSVLGIDALTAIAPLAPGAPLCRALSERPEFDGLELALKGGQVGGPDFFVAAKTGLMP